MVPVLCDASKAVVVLVDLQPNFMKAIPDADFVCRRSEFVARVAKILGIPVLATEQYASRMGPTAPQLAALVDHPIADKLSFSCCGHPDFIAQLESTGRTQATLVGIETHICVMQTAMHLRERAYEVVVGADALSARSRSAHELGLRRLENAGITLAHTESIVYEWMRSAEHPKFKEALSVVKEFAEV